MNPYDFARIDWNKKPERRKPAWHHRLTSQDGQRLYSGFMEIDIYAETPLFIADPRNVLFDARKAALSMRNQQGDYIIPGSSLKGMLRCVAETLGNGCLTLFDGEYERNRVNYKRDVPYEFQHCGKNDDLCITCRMFGMLKDRISGVFLGKVNIGDACSYPDKVYTYDPIYTAVLVEPKPHHAAFYKDPAGKHIAGRKFYFHHSSELEPLTADRMIMMGGKPANRYIQPLDYDTKFHFRMDFTNLDADEFALLMLSVTLEEGMRHKIGYGKPTGLGTIELRPTTLTLINYAARYTQPDRGKTTLVGDDMWNALYKHIDGFIEQGCVQIVAFDDLRRIWRWPPEPGTKYYYPSKRDWFDSPASHGKRIADTRTVP